MEMSSMNELTTEELIAMRDDDTRTQSVRDGAAAILTQRALDILEKGPIKKRVKINLRRMKQRQLDAIIADAKEGKFDTKDPEVAAFIAAIRAERLRRGTKRGNTNQRKGDRHHKPKNRGTNRRS
jgi:hypothetical protein